jgi:DNA invertase Pin-like site-specific DNA recombinase
MRKRTTLTTPRRKAYSYVRFSTAEQAKGDSKRRQTTMAAEYATLHGLDLDDALTFHDLGVSGYRGRNAETGKLGEFLEAVHKGIVPQGSVLLVENLDRISRQAARKALRVVENIVDAGVSLVTLTDGKEYSADSLDDDPMSLLMALLQLMRGNDESKTKIGRLKKTWAGKKSAIKQRILTANGPGWLTPNADRTGWVVDKAKAKVVKRIFALTLKGWGVNKIGQTLNLEGVPPIGRADRWHVSFIQKIIRNPAVVGDLHDYAREYDNKAGRYVRKPTGKVFSGYYPRIITPAAFKKVAAQYANAEKQGRGRGKARNGIISNTFAGLARCPKCGGSMTNVNKGGKNKRVLACIKAKQGGDCTYHSVKLERLEMAFLCSAATHLAARVPSGRKEVDAAVTRLREQTEKDDQQLEMLREVFSLQPSSHLAKEIGRVAAELEAGEEALRAALAKQQDANHAVMQMRTHDLEDAIGSHSVDIGTFTITEQYDRGHVNACLHRLFDRIVVDYFKEQLVFCWRNGAETRISYKDKPNMMTHRGRMLLNRKKAA